MQITRVSPVSGLTHTFNINITPEQLARWEAGALIQDAMPNISAQEREFILTGCTPADWENIFGEEE